MIKIIIFGNIKNREPYSVWIETLDIVTQAKIYAYVDRIALGGGRKNLKPVGDGVFEIKIDYGPGYRVYFGRSKNQMILLLGGDKSSQDKNIQKAKEFWRIYESK
ncbi:MAG: hypothetical protein A2Z91_02455 [Deltaproteobacteria bacterium GWA2_38_16]|nr:MAG: hypothetical protein A2Z91_02455 [Deltaproteobacteria bacterium GWA2_38_16]OGQ02056.1 MAG: hypothetical protein A3D19_08750 [Deltaproteobacteria bacterium RIFCSPHIGHO2_02_FULL_38_15]OGQ33538.1 MAG: hypothetical protein A3A72_08695 [Deltaproteobacteria bacterium RIFCSPLOWO2_01_FULL_38_9]OGQ64223.1 MAG: hypothetical protein A3G92_06430 [Deltaproteobacteria bacterium RIFCSPLOWO2_12_FULL_38_8]HBQ21592.1 addiction module killer protein [Deltaproteobacteria bacterium]